MIYTFSEFRDVMVVQRIVCAACGGRAPEHGPRGECRKLERRPKRHGQLESLR